jgi:hypothetical protein
MNNMFSERDNFIVASTIMVTSSIAKKIPRPVRLSILKLLRDTKYPSITNEEWQEIADGINGHKKQVLDVMMKSLGESLYGKFSGGLIGGDKLTDKIRDFDKSIKEAMDDIDFDELKNYVEDSDDPKIRELWLQLKQMKRDFDEGK